MKRLLIIVPLVSFVIVPSVFAAPKTEKKNDKGRVLEAQEVIEQMTPTPSIITPTVAECDPNGEWKNHGQYVSCVAHQKLGGQVVSAAAKSDVGKKKHDIPVTPTASISPTLTSTPTPTDMVTPTPTASVSPTLTPPLTSAETTMLVDGQFSILDQLASAPKRIMKLFEDLISSVQSWV